MTKSGVWNGISAENKDGADTKPMIFRGSRQAEGKGKSRRG